MKRESGQELSEKICPLCGSRMASGEIICEACGHSQPTEPSNRDRFLTPLPCLLMFVVPAVVTAASIGFGWLDKTGFWEAKRSITLVAVIMLGTWGLSAVSSMIGCAVGAGRQWGFDLVRSMVFGIIGFFSGATFWLVAWVIASATTELGRG